MNTSSKHFLVPALLLGLGLCLEACGSDSSGDTTSATGGAAGSSGSQSTGGTAGKGGASGSAGRGGSVADGGRDSSAGSSGSAQMGGNAGSGGSVQTGGSAGTGGVAGIGGGGDTPKMCSPTCQTDSDCEVGKVDGLSGLPSFCNQTLKRCMPVTYCDQANDCIPSMSAWLEPCKSNTDCTLPDLEACVSHLLSGDGSGVCASLPSDGKCAGSMKVTSARRYGTGETVPVCANTEGLSCTKHQCVAPSCDADSCSGNGACNSTTQQCECTADSDCTMPGASKCDTTTHTCECKDAEDCSAGWQFTKSEPACQ